MSPTSTAAATTTTAGDDTIYALTDQSLTSADVINGGGGTDTIIAQYATVVSSNTPVLSNVENVVLRQSGNFATTFSGTNVTGLTSLTFDRVSENTGATAQTATALGAGVSIGITNHTSDDSDTYTFTFTDAALSGSADTVTLNVTANTATTGLVTIQGTSSAVSGAGAETVSIVTSGTGTSAASTLADLDSFRGDGTTSSLTRLNVSGTANLTITNSIDFAGTDSGTIDASGMTGAATLTASGGEAITLVGAGSGGITLTTGAGNDNLTGGSGDDTFTIGAGFDTVTGGAGNDRVVLTAGTAITANDRIALGDGTRDTVAIGTSTSIATLFDATYKALFASVTSGVEVIELTAANGVTAVDFSAISQDIVYLTGGNTAATNSNLTISNVATNDVLRITADTSDTTGAATISASGALPGQTLRLELFGTGVDITATNTAATDHALAITSGISTLVIDSTKSATDTATTVNTIGGALNAAANAILNTSASNVTITGSQALTILNSTTPGVTFGAAVNADASAFTATLILGGSGSADIITGGTGNDSITAGAGNDVISFARGGTDTAVFGTHAANGTDTLTGFGTTDRLNVAALGDGTTGALTAVISSAAAQGALTDDSAYIINTSGAAANLTTSGTATVSDWTTLSQVAAYLNERFTTTTTTENVFVINVSGTTTSYVYSYVDAGTASIAAAELALVGVITRDAAIDTANVVFS